MTDAELPGRGGYEGASLGYFSEDPNPLGPRQKQFITPGGVNQGLF
jgi:hypothetical protein